MTNVVNKLILTNFLCTLILLATFTKLSYAGKNDYLVILVDGESNSTPIWNSSCTVKMFKATRRSSFGKMVFSKMSEAECERRSSENILETEFYGINGHIPPGIYFLDYYRIDDDFIRHRLILSDSKGGTTINTDDGVTRTYIQMHVAFNNQSGFRSEVSQGCITFDTNNFDKLFPSYYYFESEYNSPFTSTYNNGIPLSYSGAGNILVFVTDNRDEKTNSKQIAMFEKIIAGNAGGLTVDDFLPNSSSLKQIRTDWYIIGLPPTLTPNPVTGIGIEP